jgi:hypothetical protein
LTNYAVNKNNDKFQFNEDAEEGDSGSKWSLSGLREYMEGAGEDYNTAWDKIKVRIVVHGV